MKILKSWVVTSYTVADMYMWPYLQGRRWVTWQIPMKQSSKEYCQVQKFLLTTPSSSKRERERERWGERGEKERERGSVHQILCKKGNDSFTVHETKHSIPPLLYFNVSQTKGAFPI
jgi:hypothetical protein